MRKLLFAVTASAVALAVQFAWAQGGAAPAPVEPPKVEAPKVETPATLVLFDFETEDDLKKCEANKNAEAAISTEHATSGKQSMKLTLKGGTDFPGVYADKFAPKDWSAYSKLKIDVFADQAVAMGLTIKDAKSKDYASRYNNDKVKIEKGANTITVELVDVSDKIDLKTIRSFSLFTHKAEKDVTIYVDNIRLEK